MSNYKGGSFTTYLEAANAKIKRGGFIGMIAAACAAPALASTKPVPSPRFILVYDVCVVEHLDAIRLGHHLGGMGLEGPMIGVDLQAHGEPIRLLNIDNISPETVESLVAKFKEYISA